MTIAKVQLVSIYIFNLIDMFFTNMWVNAFGTDFEWNPIMRAAYEGGIIPFYKIFVAGAAVAFMWYALKKSEMVRKLINIPFFVYLALTIYHIYGTTQLYTIMS